MTLETKSLILRRWEESDAEDLYQFAGDPEVSPPAGWPPHQSVDESREVIRTVFSGRECYAICLKEDGRAIGAIELMLNGNTRMTDRDDECELGFWLGKPFWGRGLMPEAVREMLRHAFEDCGMTKVWIGYYEGNDRSRRVQEKCGFRYQWRTEDVDVPLLHEKRTGHVSLMTKEDWLAGGRTETDGDRTGPAGDPTGSAGDPAGTPGSGSDRRPEAIDYKAAIFDMDGTLIDSMDVWSRIDQVFLTKRGIEVPDDYADSICALGFRGTAEYTVKRFGLADSPEELMAEWSAMADDEYAHRIMLFPGAREVLLELRRRGVRLFIATALTEKMYLPCLRNNRIDGLFEKVFAVDELGISKSEAEFFRRICAETGLRPGECAVFDDAPAAVAAAREAGFMCFAVGTGRLSAAGDGAGDGTVCLDSIADVPMPTAV